jgi:hypothetical protein
MNYTFHTHSETKTKLTHKQLNKIMKNITKLFAIAIVILGFSATSFAQGTSTKSATASAKIVESLVLTNTVPLNFGTMTVPTTPATVTIAPGGVRTSTGTLSLLTIAPISTDATYTVAGDNNATYVVTLPADGVVSIISGSNSMTVNAFKLTGDLTTRTLSGTGIGTFDVGATLGLSSGQAAGSYTGSFDVTVAYN